MGGRGLCGWAWAVWVGVGCVGGRGLCRWVWLCGWVWAVWVGMGWVGGCGLGGWVSLCVHVHVRLWVCKLVTCCLQYCLCLHGLCGVTFLHSMQHVTLCNTGRVSVVWEVCVHTCVAMCSKCVNSNIWVCFLSYKNLLRLPTGGGRSQ